MKKQFKLTQPLPYRLPDASVAIHFRAYSGSILRRIWSTIAAYLRLLKWRSAALNLLSAFVGLLLADGANIPWDRALLLLLSGWLVAAGCGALNSYIDRDIDRIMYRTRRRPLPLGRIKPAERALQAGVLLVTIGLIISILWVNLIATLFIVSGATIYIFVYTMWLKRKTQWSVAVGGFAGVCALLAGWSAVNPTLTLSPLLFSIFVYLWTLGHFWGLSIKIKDDNQRANIPTLPVVYGEKIASQWTALSNLLLFPISIIPYLLGMLNGEYLLIVLIIGAMILAANLKLYFSPTAQNAWTVFKLSSPYLAGVYLAAIIDILT